MAGINRTGGVLIDIRDESDLRTEHMHADGRRTGAHDRDEGARQTQDLPEVPGDAQEVLQQEAQQGSQVIHHEEDQTDQTWREKSPDAQARTTELPQHPRGRRKCLISEKLLVS